ncbi:MAG: BadF/BadG/BcrA/BcrD ATPase family protein [Bacillota bacterium]
MNYYLGMDLGASSTKAVLFASTGTLLMASSGGPSNNVTGPAAEPKMRGALTACLQPMVDQVGRRITGICLGVTGLGIPGKRELITRLLSELVDVDALVLVNDAQVALAGAMAGGPGIIVIAGTGSIALGKDHSGQMAKAGGFGYILGDEGGGYDIARKGMMAALKAADRRGDVTALTAKFSRHFGLEHIRALSGYLFAHHTPVEEIAGLSRLVAEAAAEGDTVAQQILSSAGRELAGLAISVAQQLHWPDGRVSVAPVGGVWNSGEWLSEAFAAALASSCPQAAIAKPCYEPRVGAAILAAQACGQPDFRPSEPQ